MKFDVDLVKRAIEGDKAAISELYPLVYRYAWRFLTHLGRRSPWIPLQDLEDVCSAASELVVCERLSTVKDTTKFEAFVAGVARFIWYSHTRKLKRRSDLDRRILGPSHLGEPHLDADQEEIAYLREVEGSLLLLLTPLEARIYQLVWREEVPVDEAAKRQGTSVGNVRVAMCEIRKKLRLLLGDTGDGDPDDRGMG